MKNVSWRDSVDKAIKTHLEAQINATTLHKESYNESKSPSNAQLWIAIANLSKQIMDLTIKNRFLENALRETLPYTKKHSTIIKTKKKPIKKKKATKKKSKK